MPLPRAEPLLLLLGEGQWVFEFPRLALAAPSLAREPRGNGEPVLVLPGFATGDASTACLRAFLQLLGYRARGWGLGFNRGDVRALLPRVTEIVARRAEREKQPLRLVGWSLGGVIAREVARDRPDLVASVVTMGSPVIGGPKYTVAGPLFARRGVDLDAVEAEIQARNQIPIRVPVTAIYSKADGVVSWKACIDATQAHIEHVEVRATHTGLGFSPEVYRILARRLSQPGAAYGA